MRWTKFICCLAMAICSSGCASRLSHPHSSVAVNIQKSFLDLQPGWRIEVFTPVLKSGGYLPQLKREESEGNTLVFAAGDDLVGYETARYSIEKRTDEGVKVKFRSATISKQGKTIPQSHPLLALFDLPEGARYVRLVYMVRVSGADHDTAIAAASDLSKLDLLTEWIESGLGEKCKTQSDLHCAWIPKGVGVRIER